MAQLSALDTLIELATKQSDDAAKRLGRAVRAEQDAEQKLQMLMQYRDEYAARFQASMAAGLSIAGYRNFQLFMDKLEQAIAGQQQLVRNAKGRVSNERGSWQDSERKRISYDTLATRALTTQELKQSKREQKQTDELAARQLFYKR